MRVLKRVAQVNAGDDRPVPRGCGSRNSRAAPTPSCDDRSGAAARERAITYGIPTFKQNGQRLIYFSAASKHCAIHVVRKDHLDEDVRLGFGVGRGSIRCTSQHPLPERLVTRIVKARLADAGFAPFRSPVSLHSITRFGGIRSAVSGFS